MSYVIDLEPKALCRIHKAHAQALRDLVRATHHDLCPSAVKILLGYVIDWAEEYFSVKKYPPILTFELIEKPDAFKIVFKDRSPSVEFTQDHISKVTPASLTDSRDLAFMSLTVERLTCAKKEAFLAEPTPTCFYDESGRFDGLIRYLKQWPRHPSYGYSPLSHASILVNHILCRVGRFHIQSVRLGHPNSPNRTFQVELTCHGHVFTLAVDYQPVHQAWNDLIERNRIFCLDCETRQLMEGDSLSLS